MFFLVFALYFVRYPEYYLSGARLIRMHQWESLALFCLIENSISRVKARSRRRPSLLSFCIKVRSMPPPFKLDSSENNVRSSIKSKASKMVVQYGKLFWDQCDSRMTSHL